MLRELTAQCEFLVAPRTEEGQHSVIVTLMTLQKRRIDEGLRADRTLVRTLAWKKYTDITTVNILNPVILMHHSNTTRTMCSAKKNNYSLFLRFSVWTCPLDFQFISDHRLRFDFFFSFSRCIKHLVIKIETPYPYVCAYDPSVHSGT